MKQEIKPRVVIAIKILAAVLMTVVITGLCACGTAGDTVDVAEDGTADTDESRMTLMIYMVGSDLESRSGLATEDLQEIADSGVDTEAVNIVVCAGGTEKWRNDYVPADSNIIMHLGGDGFVVDETQEASSMGDSSALTDFLDYCTDNYHTEEYALILWDHGAGPVMGYGMDTLHDRDCLTLPEMRDALEASPFGRDRKLAWVGFDACLMASAELACIWSEYADYLVASQEVEPAFGWRYSFLKDADSTETPELLGLIAKSYLDACREYYEEKGYAGRDTTLSCMDLSKAEEVEDAVDALFGKAAEDIGRSYNKLASRRINTRALGRATTGSEYDLVDLNNAAEQLSSFYPDEAAALQEALGDLIIANETNAEQLSGVSLYYPFFNKFYYENSWADTYDQLGVFPEYVRYLEEYEKTWLGNDRLAAASGAVPTISGKGKFTLRLTPEQAESFAGARFHILMHYGGDTYMPVYTSGRVTYNPYKRTITADYDGKALYAVNSLGDYTIPVSSYLSSDNGYSHYAVNCTVYKFSPDDIWDMTPEEQEENQEEYHSYTRAWFNLAVSEEDGTVNTSAILARGEENIGPDNLEPGKAEELELGDWDYYLFTFGSMRILTRNRDGVILPVESWNMNSGFSYCEFTKYNGLDFEYAPLEAGDYSIIFEITDTQGNRYCSEPASIDSSSKVFREEVRKKPAKISWQEGDRVKLLERDGLTLSLVNKDNEGTPVQTFELVNNTDEEVKVETSGRDAIVNGNIDGGFMSLSVRAKPGETSTVTSSIFDEEGFQCNMDFGTATYYSFVRQIRSVEFCVSAQSLDTHRKIWDEEPFLVTYSEETAPPLSPYYCRGTWREVIKEKCAYPYLGARAGEQKIYEDDDLEVTLLALGADKYGYDNGFLRIVNKSDRVQYLSVDGVVYNDVYEDISNCNSILPNTTKYSTLSWGSYKMDDLGITDIQDLTFAIKKHSSRYMAQLGYGEVTWYPVDLDTRAEQASSIRTGDTTLYEKDGLRVALAEYLPADPDTGRTAPGWRLSVENDTDTDISVDMTDMYENGQYIGNNRNQWHTYWYYRCVGAHQKCLTTIEANSSAELTSVSFRLLVKSFTEDRILYTSDEVITLNVE
ncbi:MAG: hypothetical protein IJJ31_01585 [Mogibacterium sp.]|nr:hypothetical protein [Mogibacterium sp.]